MQAKRLSEAPESGDFSIPVSTVALIISHYCSCSTAILMLAMIGLHFRRRPRSKIIRVPAIGSAGNGIS
jgi:hypothetical protein